MCNDTVTFPTFIGTLYSNWDLADKEVNNEGLQKNTVIVRGSNTHTHRCIGACRADSTASLRILMGLLQKSLQHHRGLHS